MIDNLKLSLIILICLFLFVGCIPVKKIEDLGIITVRGTDSTEDDHIKSTIVIFEFNSEKTSSKIITGYGKTIKGARLNANMESNFELAPSKIQVELYGKELAEKGLAPYLDLLGRDANLPDTMYLALSKTTANEALLLQDEKKMTVDIGRYLHDVIKESSKNDVFPKVTFSKFYRNLFDVGVDPVLPLFEIVNNLPKITGIAVFKDDQYVGDLPMDDQVLFNLLEKKIIEQLFEINIPIEPFKEYLVGKQSENKELHTAFRISKGKSKSTLINKNELNFKTEIDLDLDLLELSEYISLKKPEAIKALNYVIEKELRSRYEKMLSDLKELNSDPIGYGAIYRAQYKDGSLTTEEWRKLFPDIKVDFIINVKIKNTGEHF